MSEGVPELPADTLSALVGGLEEILREFQADERAGLAAYLPYAVAGAAEVLRGAGRRVTRPVLEEALTADGTGGRGAWVVAALQAAFASMDRTRDELEGFAREQGRIAARCCLAGREWTHVE